MTELKPCPFCGQKLIKNTHRFGEEMWTHQDGSIFNPGSCILSPLGVNNTEDAIASWNRRAEEPRGMWRTWRRRS